MEYKKVEKCTRRDEPRQSNILLKERIEKCNLSKITESKILSIIECTNTANIETKRELKINREELKINGSNKILQISSEAIRESNFEYEDEWDIGGIPELLSELDADIENSLNTILSPKYDDIKNPINNKQDLLQTLQQKHCEEDKKSKNVNSETADTLEQSSLAQNNFEKSISTSKFTGFSKGGHLISKSINSLSHCSSTFCRNIGQQIKQTKKLRKQSCSVSMSSQAGNNGNSSIIVSGTINSTSQSSSGSSGGIKPNNKMSIDHQATLDKGLKMKIKRTKPGSKSSEAKHEIVKASEQHQNGLVGTGNNVCSTSQDDLTGLMSNQTSSSNSQNSNVGTNSSQGSANSSGNKKNVGGGNNQNITSSNNGNISINNAVSITTSASQPLSQGTKRGSSGHRRDKMKEKSSHSNRTAIEKNSSVTIEKESNEKCFCHCNSAEGNASTCCNNSCNRKTDNNTRLPAKNICGSISVVPPGVFTPSSDTPTTAAVSNLLAVTSAMSTSIITQTVSSCVNANTPGPPCKDTSTSNVSNVKISSHIAAQLAAAAASNNSTNVSPHSSSSFLNADIKLSSSSGQSQIVKQLSPCHTISTPVTSKKTLPVASSTGIDKLITIPNIKTENLESPPPKRLKQNNDNDSAASSANKEMVDICIGTSVGTITEPDCLGPCEPGTSVTLEGIVWHETEGGVLVVNVTWRGKTYVGTLLDCTRHDWAPPRFCDSPTEDLDARTPKGRGKRNRATTTPDLSNFTETRSSIYFSHSHVHSKLRNGSNKGGRSTSRTASGATPLDKSCSGSSLSSGNNGITPSSSPTAFLPPRAEKRKSKDESPPPVSSDNEVVGSNSTIAGNTSISSSFNAVVSQPQSLINPVTGLNVQLSSKKCKNSSSSCAVSPVLLECPENDCSKKYKHVNGLRYHQSHAHGTTSLLDEDSMADTEGHITPQPSPLPSTPPPSFTPNSCDLIPNNQTAISTQPAAPPISEESNKSKVNDEANMCQQLETVEKNFATENASSSSCEDLSTSTISSSVISSLPSSSESAPILKASNEQQKQTVDMADNNNLSTNNVFSFESNNQAILQNPTAKSGVLRYGQTESNKNNKGSCSIPQTSPNETALQSESGELDSSKKCLNDNQGLNNVAFCTEPADNKIHLNQNQHNIVSNKTSSENSNPTATKCKKERNLLADYESDKSNTCNIISREDVQSPAYSDISDDSTPINDMDHIDKQDSSKNSNLVKKSQNIELNASTDCPSSQTNISSPLNSYGVYQFYQQQQFLVPPPVEQPQQQSTKSSLNSSTISPSLGPHQSAPEFSSKKDQLEILSKANLNQPPPPNQHNPEINKDTNRTIYISGGQSDSELSNAPPSGGNNLSSTTPSKPVSHFYAFNYMPTNYSYNVDHNFGSDSAMTGSEDIMKTNRQSEVASPNEQTQQQHTADLYKDDHSKEGLSSPDAVNKSSTHQISSKQIVKSDAMIKPDFIKQESLCSQMPQIPQHIQVQGKDHQGMGVYANMYQRHPLTLASQQLSRDEELRRYYIFSDQQRRQNSSSHNVINQQMQSMPGNLLCKEDSSSSQQLPVHNQSQIKIKGNMPLNINKSAMSNTSKDSPKHKQEEEIKTIKQEGQKPTMETQGPPPPPTSQYFLHPSFLTSAPFGFDPSHPMYRNVLMPATSPYNTPSYHLPMPRFHAPEDLSRNTGTKALDALHHAASQYYTTHKIHELSERALKSPSNSNTTNAPGPIKMSGSSPNIVSTQQSNIVSHSSQNQSSGVSQMPHNLASQTLNIANKLDVAVQKPLSSVPGGSATTANESQKSQATINPPVASSCGSGNGNNNSCATINGSSTGSDSRSPPPQRHVHTHHHTHVGLGYPMYPAPYGAAVLASQQAAAVAVINPFPAGPNK